MDLDIETLSTSPQCDWNGNLNHHVGILDASKQDHVWSIDG